VLPHQLAAESFAAYPEEARRIAAARVALLQRLPLGFLPLLLRELIVYDWKFPSERSDLDRQFAFLASLSPPQLAKAMAPFAQLRLTAGLEKADWVNAPAVFAEQLTAHLWATRQIDAFRAAAVEYVARSGASSPEAPLPARRLVLVVIGQGVRDNQYFLFRKLRRHGTFFAQVKAADGMDALMGAVAKRAAAHPLPYGHWYIDGSASPWPAPQGVATVSYAALSRPRAALQSRMQKVYQAAAFDPEAFRTLLAQTRPDEIGLDSRRDAVLNRFQLSLLTEGSGTQVFATTFVQWAAREVLRRAQPLTLLARFGPRQRENPMNILLNEAQRPPELDPQGSLVDADMGAYYTWLNQQRLPGAGEAAFLVWFEDHREALAIGPEWQPERHSNSVVQLLDLVSGML
jgi:hypothetical protein